MKYDIFFSISQTPVDGELPTERTMFENFFRQVEAADELGFGVAWIAESHLSTEVQKTHPKPVVPHWQGEVGLNTNFLDIASRVFHRTQRIECGSAIMNIVTMGGPIAAAERVASFLALHGLDPEEKRRIHVGFSGGRFEFMNRALGVVPRDAVEEAAWPALRGQIFFEAAQIFLRLLAGEALESTDIPATTLTRANFRSDDDWARVQAAAGTQDDSVEIANRWVFDRLKIIPQDFRRDLLQLIIGSHDPRIQEAVNTILPVQVFNLSITRADVIDDTHQRMTRAYHPSGGAWERGHMPRTTFVFLNEQEGLSPEQRQAQARVEARDALSAYWTALQGTIDPQKIDKAADNALVGDAAQVAQQIRERFHPDDRLMLWFDFFNHDCDRVIQNMRDFMDKVVPLLETP